MGRPARPLAEHLRHATFRARRHHHLLAGADVPWPGFAQLQARYRTASSDPERRAIAVDCERAAKHARANADAAERDGGSPSLDQELLKLGKPGSTSQLLAFFPRFLRHSKGPLCGQPFRLEPWQQRFLRELYGRDKDGRRIYKRALLGLPNGNGKTALAAGLGLYELVSNNDSPEIYLAAGAKQQAQIGLQFARGMVEHGPLVDWVTTGNTLTCRLRGGTMETLSSQGVLQQGLAPSAALIDELGTFTTSKQHLTYTALATAVQKRPDGYLLATTGAGTKQDSLLGPIYQDALDCDDLTISPNGCLTVAKNPRVRTLLWWYGAPDNADPADPKIIRACNPASWITSTDLQEQRLALSDTDFRHHHLNQWPHSNPGSHNDARRGPVGPEQFAELFRELKRRYPQGE